MSSIRDGSRTSGLGDSACSGQSDGGVLRPPCHQIWGHQWGSAPLGGTGHAPIGSCPHLDGYTPTACRHPDGLLGTHPVIHEHQRTHTPLDANHYGPNLTTIPTILRRGRWRVGQITTPRHHHRTGPHPSHYPSHYLERGPCGTSPCIQTHPIRHKTNGP